MPELGTPTPEFSLPDAVTGKTVSLSDFADRKALLVMFICNHCPYVRHIRPGLASLARDYAKQDIAIVAICSNDVTTHPDDSPDKMAAEARAHGYAFPYLYDESQETAKAYAAACTPDFFLFGPDRGLVYRGQLDGARPGNGVPVTGKDLRAAIDAVLGDRPAPKDQKPSLGCNIKWKPGNEPSYFPPAGSR
jgi:thiol-disulfide isomerase/thioredoxin